MRLCSTVVNRYEKVLTTCASTQHVGLLESFYPCLYLLMKSVDLQFGCISEAVQCVALFQGLNGYIVEHSHSKGQIIVRRFDLKGVCQSLNSQ